MQWQGNAWLGMSKVCYAPRVQLRTRTNKEQDIQLNASTPIDNFVPKIMTAAGIAIISTIYGWPGMEHGAVTGTSSCSSSFYAARLALWMHPVRVHDKFGFIYRADQWQLGRQSDRPGSFCYL